MCNTTGRPLLLAFHVNVITGVASKADWNQKEWNNDYHKFWGVYFGIMPIVENLEVRCQLEIYQEVLIDYDEAGKAGIAENKDKAYEKLMANTYALSATLRKSIEETWKGEGTPVPRTNKTSEGSLKPVCPPKKMKAARRYPRFI